MFPKCCSIPNPFWSSSEVQLIEKLDGLQQLALATTTTAPTTKAMAHTSSTSNTPNLKAWFLDQYGVLHDGKQPYPGAVLALEKLATTGAKMVIISNSSRRSSTTMEKIENLGFDPSLFFGAITSGELTYQSLKRRDDPWFAALGKYCIHMTWNDRGAISLEGLDLQVVDDVDEADFVLAHGTEAVGLPSGDFRSQSIEDLERILERCAAKEIPMVVANPDFVTVEARALRVMPGTLAAKYEKLGGEVKWMGKPDKEIPPPWHYGCHQALNGGQRHFKQESGFEMAIHWDSATAFRHCYMIIYQSAMAMADVQNASDCIAVGDSLHHDIRGANAAGIKSVFITGGIHATELGLDSFGEVASLSSVHSLAMKYGAYPSCSANYINRHYYVVGKKTIPHPEPIDEDVDEGVDEGVFEGAFDGIGDSTATALEQHSLAGSSARIMNKARGKSNGSTTPTSNGCIFARQNGNTKSSTKNATQTTKC